MVEIDVDHDWASELVSLLRYVVQNYDYIKFDAKIYMEIECHRKRQ